MARKAKTNGSDDDLGAAGTSLEHNAGARADYLKSKFPALFAIDMRIEAAREKHLKPLTDDRTKLKRDMNADLDMKGADITPLYALYKRQEMVKQFDDEGERDNSLDTLREVWDALSQGGQLDFVTAIETADDGTGFLGGDEGEHEDADGVVA